MTQNTQTSIVKTPSANQVKVDSAMVRQLAGRKAVLYTLVEKATVYDSLRLLIDENGKIATVRNDTIVFQNAHEFGADSPIVVEFQTFMYERANEFKNNVYTLAARIVEARSKIYYAALMADSSVKWFVKSKGDYAPTTPVTLSHEAHFTQNGVMHGLVSVWLKALDKNTTSDLDKRAGIVGDKLTSYGLFLLQNGKNDASMRAYLSKHDTYTALLTPTVK